MKPSPFPLRAYPFLFTWIIGNNFILICSYTIVRNLNQAPSRQTAIPLPTIPANSLKRKFSSLVWNSTLARCGTSSISRRQFTRILPHQHSKIDGSSLITYSTQSLIPAVKYLSHRSIHRYNCLQTICCRRWESVSAWDPYQMNVLAPIIIYWLPNLCCSTEFSIVHMDVGITKHKTYSYLICCYSIYSSAKNSNYETADEPNQI